jgi:hypothetical protein
MEGSSFARTRFELSSPIATSSSQFTSSVFLEVGGVGGAVTVFRLDCCFCRTLRFEVKDLTSLRRCWIHVSDGCVILTNWYWSMMTYWRVTVKCLRVSDAWRG